MKYTETLPSEKFKEIILNYWQFEIPAGIEPFVHDAMPENTVSVVFINQPYFKGIRILGPQLKKFQQQVYPGSVYVGIRFNPWVISDNLFGNKTSITNRTLASPDFLSELFKEINLCDIQPGFSGYSLIEKSLNKLAESNTVSIDLVTKYICLKLTRDAKIEELITDVPLSVRPLQKRFKSVTGITMRDFRNICRLRNTMRMIYLKNESITNAAFENGYADHSHFVKAFKSYMGISTKTFLLKESLIEVSI